MLAETPPVVGSVKTEINGILAAAKSTKAEVVFANCINDKNASCIRAPPLELKQIKGAFLYILRSTALTNFSPTAEPIEPPRNLNSKAQTTTPI